ncbi:MarR family transcriptional regulator [Staphylococcus capitis]|uniref:transcriptional regulator, SarA/Rot family n=3 Tax=Staphylococcus capitis TaxID=29388 RepID=UPI0015CFAD9F|nr:MarR family transcriptional regulator [Staphylococcus capitis]MBF0712114.1 MarR family transcriptional regulator [Staphylococcus capitis]NYS87423.1 MarR family transcriptional regulator [Staphylococcus capitis]
MNEQKLEKLLGFYKQYKALSEYIDKEYKLTLNDLAVLDLARKYCSDEQILMQSFLKIAISELELSRTKLLVSIRRLIDKEKLSKVRSTRDERKIFLYMSEENLEIFNALFDDVENFLCLFHVYIHKYYAR